MIIQSIDQPKTQPINVSGLMQQMNEENKDLKIVVNNVSNDLEKNINFYINKDEYIDYISSVIKFTFDYIKKGGEYQKIMLQIIKYNFEFLKSHNIIIIKQLLLLIDLISDRFMNLNNKNKIPKKIVNNYIIEGMAMLHYPYSKPYSTVLFSKKKRFLLRNEYKILNNLEETIKCKENLEKYMTMHHYNEIAYMDYMRSIYYIDDDESNTFALLKLFVIYLKFSLKSNNIPEGKYNFENNYSNFEILLNECKSTSYVIVEKCVLWIIYDRLTFYKDDVSIDENKLLYMQSVYRYDKLRLIIYDYFLTIKRRINNSSELILNFLFEYIKLFTTNYRMTDESFNSLINSFDYICGSHDGAIYIEIDALFRIKLGTSLINLLLIKSYYLKKSNIINIKSIIKIKNKKYVNNIIKTIEIYCIKHFNILTSDRISYIKLKKSSRMFIISIIYLFNVFDSRSYSNKIINEFCKLIISSKVNICLKTLYSKTNNTLLDECIFYLCLLVYKCYYYKMNNDEKFRINILLQAVIYKNNPKVGDMLYKNQNILLITEFILNSNINLPYMFKTYLIGNRFRFLNHRSENIIINSNNVIETTKSSLNNIKDFKYIKWKIQFINENVKTDVNHVNIWLNLFCKELKKSNLFKKVTEMNYYYPSIRINVNQKMLSYYELVGIIIGISLTYNINFKLELSLIIYKKILGLPCNYSDFEKENKKMCEKIKNIDFLNPNNSGCNVKLWDEYSLVNIELKCTNKDLLKSEEIGLDYLHSISKIYLETGINDQIKYLINGMSKVINLNYLKGINEVELRRLIFGYELYTSDNIATIMRFNTECIEKSYMQSFIAESKNEDLNKIIRNIIGDRILKEGEYINIIKTKSKDLLILCGFKSLTVEIPNFPDYKSFKKQMNYFINHAI
ncbi:E3 ubiquitin-protein ligase HACE1 [Astathelohania contejeani]|uniref:HECT-type E3 ubiquitin transferase n=1 Tax=Astathelohania contejeani TaxID=164912 RepID=A0ABQ7I1W3_9MICR|nr:E3 ubiquitin-protein ligase HACE1 [Thelohania contejeani]